MSMIKTDRKTDRGQCVKSNAAIPRPLTLVRPTETLTGDWPKLDERTSNVDANNHVSEHHLQANDHINWDSVKCITFSTDYYQRLTLGRWFTDLEQTPLN